MRRAVVLAVLLRPGRAALAVLCLLLALAACEGPLQQALDDAVGSPQATDSTGTDARGDVDVPSGPLLACLTNVGHTLFAFDLAGPATLPQTQVPVDLDPVGPWFSEGVGYYLSRVHQSGAGANALIAFDPATFSETGRLQFPPNSNPSTLLVLPEDSGTAWVGLRGSTFDGFATNGIAVVDLAAMRDTTFADLADLAPDADGPTSLVGLLAHADCAAGDCIYAIVNNWNGTLRDGWLLVLQAAEDGTPVLLEQVALGINPQEAALVDGNGVLWVVNNGGYADADGTDGTVQALDTAALGDGASGGETLATLEIGGDPTGIYAFSADRAWVTTYPDDAVRTVDLATRTLDALDLALPTVTGPLFSTSDPQAALWAATGGFSAARLLALDADSGAQTASYALEAGNGPLSCAPFTNP